MFVDWIEFVFGLIAGCLNYGCLGSFLLVVFAGYLRCVECFGCLIFGYCLVFMFLDFACVWFSVGCLLFGLFC